MGLCAGPIKPLSEGPAKPSEAQRVADRFVPRRAKILAPGAAAFASPPMGPASKLVLWSLACERAALELHWSCVDGGPRVGEH